MNTEPDQPRPRLHLDFGNGSLSAVNRDGKEYVRFRDLVRFVGADYATELDTARNNGIRYKLRDEPDGEVLLELCTVPMWLVICENVAAEHSEGHAAFVRSIMDARVLEPVAIKHFPELVLAPNDDRPFRWLTRERAYELLKAEGWEFIAIDDRFKDEPDYDPHIHDSEVWRRETAGRVEWCSLNCLSPQPGLPPEQCYHRDFLSIDPREMSY